MGINVIGATLVCQFIDGDPSRFEWRVSYQIDGRDVFYESVSSLEAESSRDAVEIVRQRYS